MKVALITAIFSGYDILKRLPVEHGFDDAVCVTDNPHLQAEGWRMIVEQPHENPRLMSKRPKMRPHAFVDADLWVWVDGQIKVQPGLRDFAVNNLGHAYLAAFEHPERNCLYQEADVCIERKLAPVKDLRDQVSRYDDLGMPRNFGLWECAVIVWSKFGVEFGDAWLREVRRSTIRDQISLPYVAWRDGVTVKTLPGRSRRSGVTVWTPHRRHHG